MRNLLTVSFLAILCAADTQAQNSSEAMMQALLNEVRQLRLALEKSTTLTPRIQMTLQRMQLQQDSVSRASRELEEIRGHLTRSAGEEASISAQLRDVEAGASREQDGERRKTMENQTREMKTILEQRRIEDSQLRGRESETAGRLRTEQAKLDELNERLNSLERLLDAPQARQQ